MHLEVVLASDYSFARKLTYEAGRMAMKKATNRITRGISSMKLLMKSQDVNMIVSAVNNHRYRVFLP